MCGIMGYVGSSKAAPILLEGLAKLEYRGYDSAGIAVFDKDINIAKAKGRLQILSDMVDGGEKIEGCMGIGHTRWATHGEPSDVNSHPHYSQNKTFAIVHNGIIENYLKLKNELMEKGFKFVSQTDTEIVANLLEYYYNGNILDTIIKATSRLEGSYALGILCQDDKNNFYAVRKDSPLIIGLGKGENYIASDIPAILSRTRSVYMLEENEFAIISSDSVKIVDSNKQPIEKTVRTINWDVSAAEKGGYDSFMFKEIMEEPKAIRDTIHPRLSDDSIVLDDITLTKEQLEKFNKIYIVGCGSAYHVGMVGKYIMEKHLRIPVEVMIASEFRYCDPIVDEKTLVIMISQSGETADTLAALRECKKRNARILSIVNVVGSSIANESNDVIYTWAGPEIAVATTKAYSTQLTVIYLIALYIADKLGKITKEELKQYITALRKLPDQVQQVIDKKDEIEALAKKYYQSSNVFFLGRNYDYAVAMEGSLKLKEISYIHSEAYAAGELKHGTISLIEDGTLVVSLATCDKLFDKMMSNVKEVKARGAVIFSLAKEGNKAVEQESDYVFYLPDTFDMLLPSLTVTPLQLFGYYVAKARGYDIDKPRNLAKSVTVE